MSQRRRRRTFLEHGPREVDVLVGSRVRYGRTLAGLSQTELAESIGLTFQQLQKYERGMNRVSASKLWQIAQVLQRPVQWSFEDGSDVSHPVKRETLELARCFNAAPEDVRKAILQFVKAVGNSNAV